MLIAYQPSPLYRLGFFSRLGMAVRFELRLFVFALPKGFNISKRPRTLDFYYCYLKILNNAYFKGLCLKNSRRAINIGIKTIKSESGTLNNRRIAITPSRKRLFPMESAESD